MYGQAEYTQVDPMGAGKEITPFMAGFSQNEKSVPERETMISSYFVLLGRWKD